MPRLGLGLEPHGHADVSVGLAPASPEPSQPPAAWDDSATWNDNLAWSDAA